MRRGPVATCEPNIDWGLGCQESGETDPGFTARLTVASDTELLRPSDDPLSIEYHGPILHITVCGLLADKKR